MGAVGAGRVRLGTNTLHVHRDITFPLLRSALLAGELLAFALSVDEIVVAAVLVLFLEVPVYLAQRLTAAET